MNQATIGSPIDGTVVAVNLNVGDTVSAASSTANVVVQGAGGYEVATTVSVDRVGQVAVGQPATLVPDGGRKALTGKVAYISVVPTTSSTTSDATPTYLVIVGLDRSDSNLENGSTGTCRSPPGAPRLRSRCRPRRSPPSGTATRSRCSRVAARDGSR